MPQGLLVCEHCDVLHAGIAMPVGGHARCTRCGGVIAHDRVDRLEECLALALASLVLFLLANLYPVVGLELSGSTSSTTLWYAAVTLFREGIYPVSALLVLTTMLAPALELLAIAAVLLPLCRGQVPRGFRPAVRILQAVRPWGMIEVFVMGAVVALVKLTHVAHVLPGVGLVAFGMLILTMAGTSALFDVQAVWRRASALTRPGEGGGPLRVPAI